MKGIIYIILSVIVGIVLLGAGYGYGMKEPKGDTITSLPRFPLIQEWRTTAGGEVVEITDEFIIISTEGVTLSFAFAEYIKIDKSIAKEGKLIEKIENLTPEDIKLGDLVSAVLVADIEGSLYADSISIFEVQQVEL